MPKILLVLLASCTTPYGHVSAVQVKTATSLGTGVPVAQELVDGHWRVMVLTAAHVVRGEPDAVLHPTEDVALVQVWRAQPVQLGRLGAHPVYGERVFVQGYDRAGQVWIAAGLVSGPGRMTAPIVPGYSGGPVTNEAGEVVGVSHGMASTGPANDPLHRHPVYHHAWFVPIDDLREWLAEHGIT